MNKILRCPCGQPHYVSSSQAGQQLTCTSCGKQVTVPTLRELRDLPDAAATVSQPATSTSVWKTWRGPTMATFVALFLITGGMSLRFTLQRLNIDTSYDEETEIELGEQLFDQYGPDALSMTWEQYQTVGIGPKQRLPFMVWRTIAWHTTILASVTGTIAAICLLAALAVWYSARRAARRLQDDPRRPAVDT